MQPSFPSHLLVLLRVSFNLGFDSIVDLTVPRVCNNSRLMRKQLMEEHEQALEFERRRMSEMQLTPKPLNHRHSYFGDSMDELKFSEGIYISWKLFLLFPGISLLVALILHSDIIHYNSLAHAEQSEFPSAERFNYLLDVLNNGSTSEDNLRHISTNFNEDR